MIGKTFSDTGKKIDFETMRDAKKDVMSLMFQ
jgi:hypothetical protein